MRNVVGFLLAAAVGIHCSAPAETSETSTSEVVVAPPAEAAQRRTPTAPEPEETTSAPSQQLASPELAAVISDTVRTHVTSSIQDADGATFTTGTFVGSVWIGNVMIHSRGAEDVFLVKLDAKGRFEWVRAVGSAAEERSPRVTISNDRVNVLGMTEGDLDCGGGPLPGWSSDTFFMCTFGGVDGTMLSGGVFPTGAP